MCELNFKPCIIYSKPPIHCSGCGKKLRDKDEASKYQKLRDRRAIMFYNQWDDTIYINSAFQHERHSKRYPFNDNLMEDDTARILNHEAIHQALNHTAGWVAAKRFDKIAPYWSHKYWMDPP